MVQTLPPAPERTRRQLDHPQHWLWKVVGITLIVVCVVPILWAHVIAPGSVDGPGTALHIDPQVCDADRWLLASERYAEAGWPTITIDREDGQPIIAVAMGVIPDGYARLIDGDLHGPERLDAVAVTATGERIHMMRSDQCGASDCTAEHKIWHMFQGGEHWGPTGYVGSAPASRCGLKIPPYRREAPESIPRYDLQD